MGKTKIKAEDYPFVDLYCKHNPERFCISSWRDEDTIYFQFGITTLAIPLEDWTDFVSAVNTTELHRKAEEQGGQFNVLDSDISQQVKN
jgi:hypothetical protein